MFNLFLSNEEKEKRRIQKAKEAEETRKRVAIVIKDLEKVITEINKKKKEQERIKATIKAFRPYDDSYLGEYLKKHDNEFEKKIISDILKDRSIERRTSDHLNRWQVYLMLLFTAIIALFTALNFFYGAEQQ